MRIIFTLPLPHPGKEKYFFTAGEGCTQTRVAGLTIPTLQPADLTSNHT